LWVTDEEFSGYFEYSTDLFDESTIARMDGEYRRLLEALLAHPDCRLSELPAFAKMRAALSTTPSRKEKSNQRVEPVQSLGKTRRRAMQVDRDGNELEK
jgi:hypothetical protein